MASIWGELKRRNVVKVAMVYAVVTWLLMQIVDTAAPALHLPDWTLSLITLLLIVGFPFALIFAWAFELTPEGIKPSKSVESTDNDLQTISRKLGITIIGVLALAVGFMFLDNYVFESSDESPAMALEESNSSPPLRPSIAALPFVNASVATENSAFFADGMHDELLTRLAGITTLKTISRTSVMEYRDTTKNMRQIGEELGVTNLLQGRVQQAGDMLRITVQLIDAATDESIWQEIYNRELTAENIFAIQAEMATAIATALQQTLSPEQTEQLNARPTLSTRAYEFYLIGNDYFRRAGGDTFTPLALQQFERAVAEDPTFALAWAALSRAHSRMYWHQLDRTQTRLQNALSAANRAFELVPNLPEAHIALADYYYRGFLDFNKALEELAIAERDMPNSVNLLETLAEVHRRNENPEGALDAMERAIELDPRNTALLLFNAATNSGGRNPDQVHYYLDRVLEIEPDNAGALERKVLFGLWQGDDLTELHVMAENPLVKTYVRGHQTLWLLRLHEREFETALEFLDTSSDDVWRGTPKALFYGVTHQLAGQPELAVQQFSVAKSDLERMLAEQTQPDPGTRSNLLMQLARVITGLGDFEEAKGLAEEAMQLMPPSVDSISGKFLQAAAILGIFVPAGDFDRATELLDTHLLSPPGWLLEGLIRDPRLDPIREYPPFLDLVEKYKR